MYLLAYTLSQYSKRTLSTSFDNFTFKESLIFVTTISLSKSKGDSDTMSLLLFLQEIMTTRNVSKNKSLIVFLIFILKYLCLIYILTKYTDFIKINHYSMKRTANTSSKLLSTTRRQST